MASERTKIRESSEQWDLKELIQTDIERAKEIFSQFMPLLAVFVEATKK